MADSKSFVVHNPALAGRVLQVGRVVVQFDRDGTAILPAWAESEYAQLVGTLSECSRLAGHGGTPEPGYRHPGFDAEALAAAVPPPTGLAYPPQPFVDPTVAPATFAPLPSARAEERDVLRDPANPRAGFVRRVVPGVPGGVHAPARIGTDPARTDDLATYPPGTPPVDRHAEPGPHDPPVLRYTDFEVLKEAYPPRGGGEGGGGAG